MVVMSRPHQTQMSPGSGLARSGARGEGSAGSRGAQVAIPSTAIETTACKYTPASGEARSIRTALGTALSLCRFIRSSRSSIDRLRPKGRLAARRWPSFAQQQTQRHPLLPCRASCSTTVKHLPRSSPFEEGYRRQYPRPRQTTSTDVPATKESRRGVYMRAAVPRAAVVLSDALSMHARRWACEVVPVLRRSRLQSRLFSSGLRRPWVLAEGLLLLRLQHSPATLCPLRTDC